MLDQDKLVANAFFTYYNIIRLPCRQGKKFQLPVTWACLPACLLFSKNPHACHKRNGFWRLLLLLPFSKVKIEPLQRTSLSLVRSAFFKRQFSDFKYQATD